MTDNVIWFDETGQPDPDFMTRQVSKIIFEHLEPDEHDMAFLREIASKDHARAIANASDDGQWLEQSKNIKVSTRQTIKELENFQKFALRLADAIDSMHLPALERLKSEGADVNALAATLQDVGSYTEHALSQIDEAEIIRGRHKKHAAKMVTEASADCYIELTGLKPTLTVDPQNSAVSGRWFEFLSAIFAVLRLDESPESQARAFMEKNSTKSGV
jgi:hypothetical protein